MCIWLIRLEPIDIWLALDLQARYIAECFWERDLSSAQHSHAMPKSPKSDASDLMGPHGVRLTPSLNGFNGQFLMGAVEPTNGHHQPTVGLKLNWNTWENYPITRCQSLWTYFLYRSWSYDSLRLIKYNYSANPCQFNSQCKQQPMGTCAMMVQYGNHGNPQLSCSSVSGVACGNFPGELFMELLVDCRDSTGWIRLV